MAVLNWLETTGLSMWVREGESIWAFPTILTLHTFGLGLLVGANTVVDLRVLGIGRRLPLAPLRPLFSVMWAGFWLNAVTGSLLFAADATARGTSTFFLAKLIFVAIGVAAMVSIKRSAFDAPPDAPASSPKLMALVSLGAWTAAITTGRLLAYV
jgi:hypothetical protein